MSRIQQKRNVQNSIRWIFIILIAAVNILSLGKFLKNRDIYTVYFRDLGCDIESTEVVIADETVAEYLGADRDDTHYYLRFRAAGRGDTGAWITIRRGGQTTTSRRIFHVNRLGMLINYSHLDFDNWHVLMLGVLVSLVLLCSLLFQSFITRVRTDLYDYKTIQTGGVSIFALGLTLLDIPLCLVYVPNYRDYFADSVWFFFRYAFTLFVLCAIPFIVLLSIALSISNIQLIRKEGFRFINILGIVVSLFLLSGVFIFFVVPEVLLSSVALPPFVTKTQYVVLALFCFFLSFLLSTMICGLIAAKRVPEFNQDFIIILGCRIRKDGTLPPLLQGRTDRAIWFWNRQYEMTGKKAVFLPSGGQGSDEIISEGEAVRRYLISRGIPEEFIIAETASTTTLENMKFSKAIIEKEKKNANVIFSTTNYHVFRSGIMSKRAGLKAKGIGSRTKWYFWPNAFMREFAGLLQRAWKLELLYFGTIALAAAVITLFW